MFKTLMPLINILHEANTRKWTNAFYMIWDMFFVVRSNDSFNFPLGLIKYIVIVTERQLDSQKHKWMFWTPFNKTLWSLARAIPVLRMSASGTIRWTEDRSDDKTRFAKFGTVVSRLTLPGWRHCCLMFAAVCQWTVLGQLISQAKTQVALKVSKDSLRALNDYSISYALKVLLFLFRISAL